MLANSGDQILILVIACVLITGFGLASWWYWLAVGAWFMESVCGAVVR